MFNHAPCHGRCTTIKSLFDSVIEPYPRQICTCYTLVVNCRWSFRDVRPRQRIIDCSFELEAKRWVRRNGSFKRPIPDTANPPDRGHRSRRGSRRGWRHDSRIQFPVLSVLSNDCYRRVYRRKDVVRGELATRRWRYAYFCPAMGRSRRRFLLADTNLRDGDAIVPLVDFTGSHTFVRAVINKRVEPPQAAVNKTQLEFEHLRQQNTHSLHTLANVKGIGCDQISLRTMI